MAYHKHNHGTKHKITLTLSRPALEWLEDMAHRYKLPSKSEFIEQLAGGAFLVVYDEDSEPPQLPLK